MVSIISIVHYTKYQVIEDNKFRKNERVDYDRIEDFYADESARLGLSHSARNHR